MLKDISSVKLQGANFSSIAVLPILSSSDGKYTKVSLIYGRNGAGKSTLAKAFRKIKGESVNTITTTDALNMENQPIALSEAERASIFVFDEDFIATNVRIEGSGLGSIVMLGEQVDLTTQIEQAERELKKAEKLVKTTSNALTEYQTNTNPKAPNFYIKKIRKVLQGDDGWAGRDSRIKSSRQNSRVNDETYKRFITPTPEKPRDELVIAFDRKMKELELAKNGVSKIVETLPHVPNSYQHYSITLANELIKKKIEEPELSEREKYLFSLVTAGKTDKLQERIGHLKDRGTTFCPYCLQDLTTEYKANLVMQIQKVLTDEVKNHQTQLKSLEHTELTLELSPFSILPSYQTCMSLIVKINETLVINNTLIQRKFENPYEPIIDEELTDIIESVKSLDKTLKKLEEERKAHNNKAINTKPLKDALRNINDQIAYYDIIDYVKQLDIQEKEMTTAQKAYNDAVTYRDEKKKTLEDLNGRRKSIDIAVDIINNGLKYILFAEDRLTIERDGDSYKLLSNGHPVLPKDVSVGERNIIGLCYFFASIMTGKNKDTAYNNEYLIIIDDPISSYDFENKVGILSFLKYKLGQFLDGNENSRAIILTHDLLTLFDFEKMCEELNENWNNIFQTQLLKYHLWELKNCALEQFKYKKRQEYTELIRLIYEYGCGNAGEYDIVIGNIMRQALEAFATFEYKKGIAVISTNEKILSKMCNEHKSYFKNLMYRIVLNNGSHREEQTRSMEIDFLSVISESEKRRTAKEIICFIYLLNKEHVLAHLHDLGDVSIIIDTWCEDIKKRAAVI